MTQLYSLRNLPEDPPRYLYGQTQNDFPWGWQSTLPAFHINPLLCLLSFVSVPLCLPFFKYITINNAFTPVVLMSWISYLTSISVSQASIWESIISYALFPKPILHKSYLPYAIWYKYNFIPNKSRNFLPVISCQKFTLFVWHKLTHKLISYTKGNLRGLSPQSFLQKKNNLLVKKEQNKRQRKWRRMMEGNGIPPISAKSLR